MKAVLIRHLNDIVGLTILALMAMALVAGQVEAAAHTAQPDSIDSFQVILEVRAE